jgi:hypothetical protein
VEIVKNAFIKTILPGFDREVHSHRGRKRRRLKETYRIASAERSSTGIAVVDTLSQIVKRWTERSRGRLKLLRTDGHLSLANRQAADAPDETRLERTAV